MVPEATPDASPLPSPTLKPPPPYATIPIPSSTSSTSSISSLGSLPQSIAHRGYRSLAPENTLAAFLAAARAGAHAIETDVHLSRDGVVVLSHDATLKRCFGVDRHISTCDWEGDLASLRTARAPHEPMARLSELLDLLAGPEGRHMWALIDVKMDDDPTALLTQIRRTIAAAPDADWPSRLAFGCWTESDMRRVHDILPEYRIAYICVSALVARSILRRSRSSPSSSNKNPLPPIHILNMGLSALVGPLGSGLLREAAAQGKLVTAWTVDNPAWMRWCTRRITHGGVISDDPGLFLRVCAADEEERTRNVPWRLYFEVLRTKLMVAVCLLGIWLVGGSYDGVAMRVAGRKRNALQRVVKAAET